MKNLKCPICGSYGEVWSPMRNGPTSPRHCCGILHTWKWTSIENYENQYRDGSYHTDACRAIGLKTQQERFDEHCEAARSRLKSLRWLLEPGARIIDIGASNGAFVYESERNGYKAIGIEPCADLCQWSGERYGLDLRNAEWKMVNDRSGIIIACDVVEHLLQPREFFSHVRTLAPWLYIETPEWRESRNADWKHLKPQEHVMLYGKDSICELAHQQGWKLHSAARPIKDKIAILFCADHILTT